MALTNVYIIISVLIVSLVSFVGALSLVLGKKDLSEILLFLVSLSAGTLLGGALLHLLPEAVEELGFSLSVSLLTLAGMVSFFILESVLHQRVCEVPQEQTHSHRYPLAHESHKHHLGILNLVGDALHNFIDGLVIAGSYFVSVPLGIATTVAVVLHEIPQELADFGVLLYSGFSKGKALLANFLSAAIAIIGAVIGIILGSKGEMFSLYILPFAAGGFLYIAGVNLIPELHKECGWKKSLLHLFALLLGIAVMVGILYLE
ncbi:MAG: ZIP family metal transporter [Nanoarchaeota archaeon]|nr:ZIP family metal transporter [Nanoarchaeota archaeon]